MRRGRADPQRRLSGVTDAKRPAHSEREQKAREEKLRNIAEQVEDGSLVIRQMTPQERKANPPRPREQKQRRGR
jgi:hypothetical protein